MTEWADFYEYTTYSSASVPIPQKKGIGKLLVRLELDEGASVKIEMQFDSDGVWREVKTLQAEKKRSFYLPIVPRRCDHFRILMTGSGAGCIRWCARSIRAANCNHERRRQWHRDLHTMSFSGS